MFKHTQKLSVFDHFVGLALKGLDLNEVALIFIRIIKKWTKYDKFQYKTAKIFNYIITT